MIPYEFEAADLNTILAALRFYQEQNQGDPAMRSERINEIATNGGEDISLDAGGIDELCEAINSQEFVQRLNGGFFAVRTMWTATTDGDNCSLTTTLHVNEADARARVIRDLAPFSKRGNMSGLTELDTEKLCELWEQVTDGACIIEPHNVEVEA